MYKKIILNPVYKETQKRILKTLYDLREDHLRGIVIILNNDYARSMTSEIKDIQDKISDLYNSLTNIANFYEREISC